MSKQCYGCFENYNDALDMCPYCGFEDGDAGAEPYFLYPGMVLNNRYIVGQVLGFGGFGITYKAWDKNMRTVVAIKEYYYTGLVARDPGTQVVKIYAQNRRAEFQHFLNRFLDEARYTAKFGKNPNIVNVFEFFEANNTAYMVMEYLEGMPLSEFIKKNSMDTDQCISVIQSICSALKTVHADGIIHRDISPDNIYLCSNGKVKLLDFGAARFSANEEQNIVKMTQVMKPGFSPPEQYQTVSKQGAWTDIYALGATLYYMITGVKPVESTNRKTDDTLIPPMEIKPDIPEYINDTILRAMAVETHLRFANVDEFEKALLKEKRVLSVVKEKKRRRKNRFIGVLSAAVAVTIGLSVFYYFFEQQRLAETLPESTIELWYIVPESEEDAKDKKIAFEATKETENISGIIEAFTNSFPKVTVKLFGYKKDEYVKRINAAFEENKLPQLFESTGLDESVLEKTMDLREAVNMVDSNEVLFFSNYKKVFRDAKQFPLGFIAPIKYTNIAPKSEAEVSGNDRDRFLAGATGEFIGSTADYYDVLKELPGIYTLSPYTEGNSLCQFTDLWSMGNCNEDQQRVVKRLLVYMLTDKAQVPLHIGYHSGSLPLNNKTLTEGYVEVYGDFDGFFADTKAFKFN